VTALNTMDNDKPNELPVIETPSAPCHHLRSKGMYVYTDGPGSELPDDDDNTAYWCFQTLKNFGPDDRTVGGHACRERSRTCYEPI
jgi:hypothetical protein